jgi:surfeit locus 1 family protein
LAIRFANRRFAPTIVGSALAVVGVAIFLQLGFWQLRRAEQKEALQTAQDAGQQSTVKLTAENVERLPRYQHVEASGRFLSEQQILLDNMPSAQGRPGYRVLTPFELSFGDFILVDRGWVPMGDRRTDVPQLAVNEDIRTVTGRLDDVPRPGLRLKSSAEQTSSEWPRVLNFPEHETLEQALGVALATRIILLDANQPEGFERTWNAVRFQPERHVGYAVQWFAFAFVAAVIYLGLSFKRDRAF